MGKIPWLGEGRKVNKTSLYSHVYWDLLNIFYKIFILNVCFYHLGHENTRQEKTQKKYIKTGKIMNIC